MDRRISAILVADAVDYTRLIEEDDLGTLDRFAQVRRAIIGPFIAQYRGRIVKLMGDGLLVEFPSARDAVACAEAWQAGIRAHEADRPARDRLTFRIGINVGEIVADAGDIHGSGVIVASRLEALAEPGGVLISDAAYRLLEPPAAERFAALGPRGLKNVAAPVDVYRLAQARAPEEPPHPGDPVPVADRPTVAVLGFAMPAGDGADAGLAEEIAEDIATELSRFCDFDTIAPPTEPRGADGHDPRAPFQDAAARFLLEGTVRQRSGRLKIGVRLIDAATGKSLWAERYDIGAEDFFDRQADMLRRITGTIGARISHEAIVQTTASGRAPESADELIRQAWALFRRFTRTETREAERLANRALGIAPESAPALRMLAWIRLAEVWHQWAGDAAGAKAAAYDLARRAAALDPRAPSSLITLAVSEAGIGQYERAIASARRAIELNPNSADGHAYLGNILALSGAHAEGVSALDTAIEIDPDHPAWYRYFRGRAHFLMRSYRAAEHDLVEAVRVTPTDPIPRLFLAATLAAAGDHDAARREIAELSRHEPGYVLSRVPETIPLKERADVEHLVGALRAAGLT